MNEIDYIYEALKIYKDSEYQPQLSNITYIGNDMAYVDFIYFIRHESDFRLCKMTLYINPDLVDWDELNRKLGYKSIQNSYDVPAKRKHFND